MLDTGPDHAAVLSRFLRVLSRFLRVSSPEDEAILTRLLGRERVGCGRPLPPPGTWLLYAGGLMAAAGSSASLALLVFQYVAPSADLERSGR